MLYNPTKESMNISGWTISSRCYSGTTITIPLNITIPPKKYLTCVPCKRWLCDKDDKIVLNDTEGNTIDETLWRRNKGDWRNNESYVRFTRQLYREFRERIAMAKKEDVTQEI